MLASAPHSWPASNKAAAQERFDAQKRGEAAGEFDRYQEMKVSFEAIKRKDTTSARRLKLKIDRSRASLEASPFFPAKHALDSNTAVLIQPQTGATAECSGSSVGIGPLFSESFVDSCSRAYENRGYVAVQRLTPEERASLERRGLLPKD